MQNIGFSMIEILSSCPANWRKEPEESNKWIDEEVIKVFPPGKIKDINYGE